jgi:S-adenosylmethionine:tRNA-ribosyltransferase-isomerase (queuine synthetase)
MRPANIELLMGHNIGISKSYYKPTEKELLEDYLKASDLLTINEEHKLKTKVKELTKKNSEKDYLINVAMMEKDREVENLKKQDRIKEEALIKLSDQVMLLMKDMQGIKNNSKQ